MSEIKVHYLFSLPQNIFCCVNISNSLQPIYTHIICDSAVCDGINEAYMVVKSMIEL